MTAAVLAMLVLAGCTSSARPASVPSSRAPVTPPSSTPPSSTPPSSTPPSSTPSPSTPPLSARGVGLPLTYPTGSARQVITVRAPSAASTVGTLQAWRRVGHGWRALGPAVVAHLGTDGLSRRPTESRSATPIGSFTLTRAFGHDADPGTALPYVQTTPGDWWISQPGPLYNTRQRCMSRCPFRRGDPNEHLYYETPYYDYAVVIDYNTANAPGGVRQGAGSAFFLHVTVGRPTQGCVSIAQAQVVRLLRWLRPAEHPRILIGVDS